MLVLLWRTSFSGTPSKSYISVIITHFNYKFFLCVGASRFSCLLLCVLNLIFDLSDILSKLSIMRSGPTSWSPVFLWWLSMDDVSHSLFCMGLSHLSDSPSNHLSWPIIKCLDYPKVQNISPPPPPPQLQQQHKQGQKEQTKKFYLEFSRSFLLPVTWFWTMKT